MADFTSTIAASIADDAENLERDLNGVISAADKEGRPLTKEEAERFNSTSQAWLRKTSDKMVDHIAKTTEVRPGDSAAAAKAKIEISKRSTVTLQRILGYIGSLIKTIVDQITNGLQWLSDQVTGLFSSLYEWLHTSCQ